MNEIIKFLLLRDKVMPEMNLKQPVITYRACGPFTIKTKKTIKI